jgi:SAM-dependent methyltransferase
MMANLDSTGALDLETLVESDDLRSLWTNESDFGLAELSPVIAAQFPGRTSLTCLEIGCGPGVLLYKMQRAFPGFTFEGVEPVGGGFSTTEKPLQRISSQLNLRIHRCGYEQFQPTQKYDLIYSVNVFEHVASWRYYLEKVHGLLAPGGVAVILCPNYAFPFEPHFVMPIIINKSVTYALMSGFIMGKEKDRDWGGMWASLNFVKRRQLTAFLKAQQWDFRYDERIMERMVARLFFDPHFSHRQRFLGSIAKVLYRLGLVRLLRLPIIRLFAPYMKVILLKGL